MTIWKFVFNVSDRFTILMPEGAEILAVQTQNETPCVWARVNPSAPLVGRDFAVFGTGHEVPDDVAYAHVGTFQLHGGTFVGHLFEVGS